jgi:diguanylate cyclase (GGDEF)-like protein
MEFGRTAGSSVTKGASPWLALVRHFAHPVRLRFNIVLLIALLASALVTTLYFKRWLEDRVLFETRRDAELLMETASAIRSYTAREVHPNLLQRDDRFYPQAVPAFAATETLRLLAQRFPAYEYREAALNPTNLRNKASSWEGAVVQFFRQSSAPKEKSGIVGEGNAATLYFAKPLYVDDAACLRCHDTPAAAPVAQVALYGEKAGMGWRLNEVVAAQIVKVPLLAQREKFQSAFTMFLLTLGAAFVLAFVSLNIVMSRFVIEPVARRNDKLEHMALHDPLTGCANRAAVDQEFKRLVAADNPWTFCAVLLDIDHFKRINDLQGHAAGDEVLKAVGAILRDRLRSNDLVARYGGEEFLVFLKETKLPMAMAVAESLRAAIAQNAFPHGHVTASFGVAEWRHGDGLADVIRRADKAMYSAKGSGRNGVRGED